MQYAMRHADARTTIRYDMARANLDRFAAHSVAAYLAGMALGRAGARRDHRVQWNRTRRRWLSRIGSGTLGAVRRRIGGSKQRAVATRRGGEEEAAPGVGQPVLESVG
jgi:hypothetical protein